MACYHPWIKDDVLLPCGQCIGCRLEYSRQWAIRIMCEASLHDANSFLTLTLDDAHLPEDRSLDKRKFPEFVERLRKSRRKAGRKVRYFHCGEYGEKRKRPHYHAILFGEDFLETREPFVRNGSKFPEWVSPELSKLWPDGQALIGSVSFESAAYVARYVCKKVTGKRREAHYEYVDFETGEVRSRVPEFATMSRRPGIAAGWFERFRSDVYPADEVRLCGVVSGPPRYFDKLLEKADPVAYERVVGDRNVSEPRKGYERTAERLHVREVCREAKSTLCRRVVE